MTLRNAIFQTHWFLGITAGLVLALVGVTGGILSFEHELLKALNPGVMTVAPRGRVLPPQELVARVAQARPEARIQSLTLSSDPRDAARLGFAPARDVGKGPGGRARGETAYVDPYSGRLLDKPRGEGFFRTTMQLHRWLAMDDVGKQIVAFATLALLFFCLSGLYLRWPRRWGSVRAWLGLDWRQRGRHFLWHLHSVVGTWVLVAYLVMALTGLTWSYPWYRSALQSLAGVPASGEPRAPAEGRRRSPGSDAERGSAPAGAARARSGGAGDAGRDAPASAPGLDIARAWESLARVAPDWSSATLQWPRDGGGVQFRYLDAEPAHERANNTLELDAVTYAVSRHERYDAKPMAQRLVGSLFALHRGSWFGVAGVLVFMLASLLMPLFAITGWMLYLDRRRKQRAARVAALSTAGTAASGKAAHADSAPVLVAYASQTGSAQRLAWQTAAALREGGLTVDVQPLGRVTGEQLARSTRALFVVSTFGEGQPPDDARAFARAMPTATASLRGLRHAVLALGDRSYPDYCGFGRDLDRWLHHAHSHPLFGRVEVDGDDPAALRHWQHHLGLLTGQSSQSDWSRPAYTGWTLREREWLNPGSPGAPAYRVALTPPKPSLLAWQAGDLVEIGPRNDPAAVRDWLHQAGWPHDTPVIVDGSTEALGQVLARSQLPQPADPQTSAQGVAKQLKPLPHREYSIASLPGDGALELLVRQVRQPDGRLGSGSGWLTELAAVGTPVDLRIRSNPSFHLPDDDRPLILVGNGTGIAGLRALLKARIAAGHHRNWLLFGERTSAHDRHFGVDIDRWQASGGLERADLTFSRDQPGCGYVQDLLRRHAAQVQQWLQAGAAVYVCGSLEGMAPAVDAALTELIGQDALEALAASGRYRRDVY